MTAEIICVGTEILLGNIVNTNAAYLAEKCAYLGLSNYYQVVVGDNEQRLLETINTAKSRADVIFLIGGLGPTEDDLTKETAAKAFNVELVMDEEAKNNIVTILTNRGIDITNNNFKQALVPKGSIVLYNKNGTAPGIIMEEAGKVVIMLPGPPNEFVPMVDDQVVPYFLKKGTNDVIYSRVVKLVGVGEKIDDLQPFDSRSFVTALFENTGKKSDEESEAPEEDNDEEDED